MLEELKEFVDKELGELEIFRDKNQPGPSGADVTRLEEETELYHVLEEEEEKKLTTFQNSKPLTPRKLRAVVAEDSVISINKKEALGLLNGFIFILVIIFYTLVTLQIRDENILKTSGGGECLVGSYFSKVKQISRRRRRRL